MSFIDVRFPTEISYGSSGGPVYNTSIVSIKSGKEKRNINWKYPRSEYDVSFGVQDQSDIESLLAMFHVAQGKGYSFRYKDFIDYKSCSVNSTVSATDQSLGTGDDSTTQFQLTKTYSVGGYSRSSRKITKPVSGTVVIAIDGVEQSSGYSVNYDTGIVTFNSAPADGETITAGFEFDVHARFDTDSISINLEDYESRSTEVPVIELKD